MTQKSMDTPPEGRDVMAPIGFNSNDVEVDAALPDADKPLFEVEGRPLTYQEIAVDGLGHIVTANAEVLQDATPIAEEMATPPAIPTETGKTRPTSAGSEIFLG